MQLSSDLDPVVCWLCIGVTPGSRYWSHWQCVEAKWWLITCCRHSITGELNCFRKYPVWFIFIELVFTNNSDCMLLVSDIDSSILLDMSISSFLNSWSVRSKKRAPPGNCWFTEMVNCLTLLDGYLWHGAEDHRTKIDFVNTAKLIAINPAAEV